MSDVAFEIAAARSIAGRSLCLSLRVQLPSDWDMLRSISLRCQVRIDPTRRVYTEGERTALRYLFGPIQDWGRTLRPFPLGVVATEALDVHPGAAIDVVIPWPDDPLHAAMRYIRALEGGVVPLLALPSGVVRSIDGNLAERIAFIPHDRECRARIVEEDWRELAHIQPAPLNAAEVVR